MELHSLDGVFFMPQSHDDSFFRRRRNLQAIRYGIRLDSQGVIADSGQRVYHAFEYTGIIVLYKGYFAMFDFPGVRYHAAEGLSDALVTETYPENRNCTR